MVEKDANMTFVRMAAALILLLIGIVACSPAPIAAQSKAPTPWLPTSPATETAMPTATAAPSDTPAPALRPAPALTPTAAATPAATATSTTVSLALPGSGPEPYVNMMDISHYMNPSGPPVQTWNGVPIMSQATDGQAFQSGAVYSFKATATVSQAADFYQSKLHPLGYKLYVGPATGTAGSGNNSIHSNFLGYSKGSRLLLIYIASYDIDAGHVFVVLTTQ